MEQRDMEMELHRLKVEFDADLKARTEANRKEISYIKATGWATSLIVAIFLSIQIYNATSTNAILRDVEDRTEELIRETEMRIEEHLRGAVPDSASVVSVDPDTPGRLTGTVSLYPSAQGTVQVQVAIPAKVLLHGNAAGRLIGYEFRYAEKFARVMALGSINQNTADWLVKEMIVRNYEVVATEGIRLAPETGFRITQNYGAARQLCQELLPLMQALLDPDATREIFIRPIFETINTPTREHRFLVGFVDNSVATCRPQD